MSPNWLGTISAGVSLAAFFLCHRWAQGQPPSRRLRLALVALLLAIPGASFTGYYLHLVPEPAWYYEFRSWSGTEFLLCFVGIAGGFTATMLPKQLRLVPLVATAVLSLAPIMKPFIAPLRMDALRDEWSGVVCMQSTPSTCGAASAATSLRSLGISATEDQLARASHSYAGGTEAWYLARTLRQQGADARFRFATGFNAEVELPAIAGVRLGAIGHFIALLARNGDRFRVGDPLIGPEELSKDELLARYQFTGFYLVLTAPQ